jgi:glutathione synthase/RimK-type ligase-like ATP-grasp enzyme
MLCWATCSELPEPDVDEQLFFDACKEQGIPVRLLKWDDPADLAGEDDVVLIRSTWDYPWRLDEFRSWVQATGARSRLCNPAEVVLMNLDKQYLRDLSVPIVPTTFVHAGDDFDLPQGKPFVIKPTVGAGSYKTRVFQEPSEEAVAFAKEIAAESCAMIQPFIDAVHTVGEQSFVFIDGEFTHKIIKTPRFEGADEKVSDAFPLTEKDKAFANLAIASVREHIVYGRVDVMEINGEWAVSEIELTEPSLFLKQSPIALNRLVNWAKSVTRNSGN